EPGPDPEELRYAPRAPRRGRWFRRALALLLVVGLIAAAAVLGYRWSQNQYYVAAEGDKVAIFRGVQADVPGVRMHQVDSTTDITIESLKDYNAEQVRAGIPAESKSDAQAIVQRLEGLATVCPPPTPSPTPSPSPTRTPTSKKASGKNPSRSPSRSASPSPSPTPTVQPPDCIERTAS
ncbi:MAG: serine/threonine-protein phosphatase, partial [Nocardioidaceae bacterium]|nr:serine/threonine-protein phosphatase [Nocardioidaceae bacterium]